MTILHHLDEATIVFCAAGTLDEASRVVVTTHIALCSQCRERFRTAEKIGSAVLEEVKPEDVSSSLFESTLAMIENVENSSKKTGRSTTEIDVYPNDVPRPLARYMKWTLDEVPWKTIVPGIGICNLNVSEETTGELKLIRVGVGRKIPEHGHQASEMTLVLRGIFKDEFGDFGPGDIAELGSNEEHAPMIGGDKDCICLIAIEGKMRFKGLVNRVLQPLVGM
jgi:putative transcriptional regulator